MRRVDAPEILDSTTCTGDEAKAVLDVIGRVNRWFGGVTTTQQLVESVARATGMKRLSLLEVAAGLGEVPRAVQPRLRRGGISLEITLADLAQSHLPKSNAASMNGYSALVADALALPFVDSAFDVVSCSLFAHHLSPARLKDFVKEGLRVSRRALIINDLVRHPLHLALAYAGFPIMRNRVAWLDGLTSVRRAYTPDEIRNILDQGLLQSISGKLGISRHYLFRMGVIVWKKSAPTA